MIVRKNNTLYVTRRDTYGRRLLFLADFDKMVIRLNNKRRKMYVNDDDVLCDVHDRPLGHVVQRHYDEWLEEHIDDILTGNMVLD